MEGFLLIICSELIIIPETTPWQKLSQLKKVSGSNLPCLHGKTFFPCRNFQIFLNSTDGVLPWSCPGATLVTTRSKSILRAGTHHPRVVLSSLVLGSKVHLVHRDPIVVEMAKQPCPRWLGRAVVVEMLDHPVENMNPCAF